MILILTIILQQEHVFLRMPMLKPPLTALDPAMEHGKPELIASATLFLMAKYACDGGCTRLASIIARHLEQLAEHPDASPVLRATCAQLLDQWDQIAAHEVARQASPGQSSGVLAKLVQLLQ